MLSAASERISELAQLNDGWLDGQGLAIRSNVLELADQLIEDLQDNDLLDYQIFPTVEGGLSFEFSQIEPRCGITLLPDGTLFFVSVEEYREFEKYDFSSLHNFIA